MLNNNQGKFLLPIQKDNYNEDCTSRKLLTDTANENGKDCIFMFVLHIFFFFSHFIMPIEVLAPQQESVSFSGFNFILSSEVNAFDPAISHRGGQII
jgi:isoprenylcysteine carboxyl methyltransferase (ICMT) family protein YpbQ